MCVCQFTSPCLSCVFVCVCVISNQSSSKNHAISVKPSFSKFDALKKKKKKQGAAGTKVPRLDKFRWSLISLSKITD